MKPSLDVYNRIHHIADAVSYINKLKSHQALKLTAQLSDFQLIELLDNPEYKYGLITLHQLTTAGNADVLNHVAEDRMVVLLNDMEAESRQQALNLLNKSSRSSILRLMSFPLHSAGSLMTTEFIQVPSSWTVEHTLSYIKAVQSSRETVYAIYVADDDNKLLFVLPLRQLICAQPSQRLNELWTEDYTPITIDPYADRKEAARLIRRHDFLALPIVDEGEIIGIVTVDDVLDAMINEASEDLGRFGGGEHIDQPYLEVGFKTMIRKRGGWLAVLFLGEMLTASAMQHYEMALEQAVVLAMFIPLIMSSGGNSGSQATSLLIRGLALGEVQLKDWWRVLLRELPTGLVLGTALGAIGFIRIYVWQHIGLFDYGEYYLLIAFTIWISLIGIVTFGSSIGSMLPFILQRVGFDPASASAPLVATLVDVLGLVIYFSAAALILTGTVL